MSAIQVHGLRLATGGAIENMVMERLAADPTPIVPGRVWYNETEKVMKFSSLNGTGAVIVETFSTAAELTAYITSNDAALAQEVSDRASADGALDGRLDVVEGTGTGSIAKALTDAQSYADTKIADLVDGAPDLLNTLNELSAALADDANFATTVASDIAEAKAELIGTADGLNDTMGELSDRMDSVASTAASDLATAKGDLENADGALDTRITTVEGQVNGKIGDTTNLTTDQKVTLVGAINEVDANADAAKQTADTEITNRTTAVQGVQDELDATQTGAGLGADGSYTANDTANYVAAATSLQDADNKLDAQSKANADAIAAETTRAQGAEGVLTGSAFSATETDLTKAVNKVSSDLAQEIQDRGDDVDAEETRAGNAESALSGRLDTVEGDENVVGSIANKVKVEENRATAAETALGTRIDNVLSNVDADAIDSITEVITAYQNADSSVMGSVSTNTTNISTLRGEMDTVNGDATVAGSITHSVGAEKTRAQRAEGSLTGAGFSVAEDDLTKAINKVSADLATEVTNRGDGVDTEEGRAKQEEQRIEGKFDGKVTDLEDEDTRIEGLVTTEVSNRTAADNQIRSDINAGRHSFQSATAALVHTVAHGLNSGSVVFNVMTEGTDGVYRNDLAPVTEVDANTLKVELSNARNVKVSVIDLSAI